MGAAAIGGGIAAAGALGSAAIAAGSKGGTGSSSSSYAPSTWQQLWGQQQAVDALQNSNSQGPYRGSFYSPINNYQTGAVDQAQGWLSGQGGQLPAQLANVGAGLLGGSGAYLANAQRLAGSYTPQNPAYTGVLSNIAQNGVGPLVNGDLSSALQAGAMTGAQSLQNAQGTLGQVASTGLQDNTARTIADANQYVNSSGVQNAISANNAMIDRTLNQQTLPTLNRQAALGGNLNSSRAGAAEAQAEGDAAIAKALSASNLQNNAYNLGVNTGSSQLLGGLSAANSAAGAQGTLGNNSSLGVAGLQQSGNEFNTNSALSAATSGLNSGLGYATLNNNTNLSANQQIGSGVNLGNTLTNAAGDMATGNYQLGAASGGLLQQDANSQLQNLYNMWNTQNNYTWDNLQKYQGIVGNQQNVSQTQTAPYSPIAGALGSGLTTYGALSKFMGDSNDPNSLASKISNYFNGSNGTPMDGVSGGYTGYDPTTFNYTQGYNGNDAAYLSS